MQLKSYQQATLGALHQYIEHLRTARQNHPNDWDRVAWAAAGGENYYARRDGSGRPVPYVCIKIPTGGGKTLLGVHAIDLINRRYCGRQTGLALWIVPTTQIYQQTLAALRDRTHPYRQALDLGSAGKTLILQKDQIFSPDDLREYLVVLLLMLPSANRQNRETLRLFHDQGGFEPFFPPSDGWEAHARLADRIPGLDTFAGSSPAGGPVVKTSLGNTLRLLNPIVILDEGHRAYSVTAQATILGFNPAFVLELSATPPAQSNLLAQIGGLTLHREEMIKLDLHLHAGQHNDWRATLLASHLRRIELEQIAQQYASSGGDYIRPICLIQVERTGKRQRGTRWIHAEDARMYLIECGVPPGWIAVKSSERNEIDQIDLLSQDCPIRYIITRHALQEGWDCPFAYVLAVLVAANATTGITQLVGRVLRQPYAHKTGWPALDESYVYYCQTSAGAALAGVRQSLADEGLSDIAGRICVDEAIPEPVLQPVQASHEFITPDGNNSYRRLSYQADILEAINWDHVNLEELVGLVSPINGQRQASAAAIDTPASLALIARRIVTIIPSPWAAYAIAGQAIAILCAHYPAEAFAAHPEQIMNALKQLLHNERKRLAGIVIRDHIRRGQVFQITDISSPPQMVFEDQWHAIMEQCFPTRV